MQSIGHATEPKTGRSRAGGLCLKQPVFKWTAKDKYMDLKQIEMYVKNIFCMKYYDLSDTDSTNSKEIAENRRFTTQHHVKQ